MALDTTVVVFTKAPATQYLMSRGINSGLGTDILQVALRSNADVSSKGRLYWRDVAILTNRPKINDVIEVFQGITGGVAKTLATVDIGRKVDVQFMYTHPTVLGKQLATKSKLTVTYPTVPIATTVDLTVPATTTILQVTLTAVTGFIVGQTVEIVTGADAIKEYSTIKSVDVTGKIIYLETPISQLPIALAAVNVVESMKFDNNVLSDDFNYYFRIVRYVHANKSNEVVFFPNAQIKAISSPDGKDGKTASESGFTLEVQSTPVFASGSTTIVEYDSLYSTEVIFA